MVSEVYQHAKYYEIAFGFIDAVSSVDLLEAYIAKFSKVEVKTVMDICCGPSLQIREFARRGYRTIGLDSSQEMLDYLDHKATSENLDIALVCDDMTDFRLDQKVDFCYIMMGSFPYVSDSQSFMSHLSSVSEVLKPGGLYLIENPLMDWTDPKLWEPSTWTIEEDGINVQTTYQLDLLDSLTQTVLQKLDFVVDDKGNHYELSEHEEIKLIFPQEFKLLVEIHGDFEFLGFFERESTEIQQAASRDNIVLLRRK